jgi:glycosyltransferase 2 family protein
MNKKTKKLILTIAKLSISLGIIAYIFTKQVDFKQFCGYIAGANPVWLLSGVLVFLITLTIGVARWQMLLNLHNIFIKFTRIIRIYCVGMFFNIFMLGITGGDVLKIYYVAKHNHKKRIESGMTVFIDRLFGIAGLIAVAFFAIILTGRNSKLSAVFWPIIFSFVAMISGIILIMNKKVIKKISFNGKLLKKLPAKDKLYDVYNSVCRYKANPKKLVSIIAISIGVHLLLAILNYTLARAIGIEVIALKYYFVIVPVICFISALPISVSGWGVGEALYVSLFGMFGVEPVKAVSLSIMIKLYYIIWGVLCGSAYVMPGLEHPKTLDEEKILT